MKYLRSFATPDPFPEIRESALENEFRTTSFENSGIQAKKWQIKSLLMASQINILAVRLHLHGRT